MMAKDFKLIIITEEKDIYGESQLIPLLFEAGLPLLHIRKPFHTLQETKALIKSIPAAFHSKIVLHGHYELLNDFNLKGAHLPERIRKESDISQIKSIVSTSFHTLEDIGTEKINFEYAFFSPVFQSISKPGYGPSSETKKIKDHLASNKTTYPLIALGGITDKNILQLPDMGFKGAACIGYIWEHHNPVEQYKKLQIILHG
jgi:thiamine-phosphate pyrophosphorylase